MGLFIVTIGFLMNSLMYVNMTRMSFLTSQIYFNISWWVYGALFCLSMFVGVSIGLYTSNSEEEMILITLIEEMVKLLFLGDFSPAYPP